MCTVCLCALLRWTDGIVSSPSRDDQSTEASTVITATPSARIPNTMTTVSPFARSSAFEEPIIGGRAQTVS